MEEVYAHVHDAGPAVSRSVHGGERGAEVASGVESASATSHQPSFRPMLLETTSILLRAPRSFHDEAASVSTLTWSSWERHHYWIIAGMARSPRHSIRRERDSPTTADDGPPKRRRLDDSSAAAVDARKVTSRRRNACQSCRLRKVKCDAVRPTCGICEASGCICCYTDPLPEKVTLESATELLYGKLTKLQDGVDKLQELAQRQEDHGQTGTGQHSEGHIDSASAPAQVDAEHITESSSEFLQIPAQRTTADAVLRWEVFEDRYPPSALVGIHFTREGGIGQDSLSVDETFTVRNGVLAPNEEQIPGLIESFLRNVHTKNPVLDAEQLVRQARIIASDGLGWGAWSCLVLLAAALGRIAKPFDGAVAMPNSPGADDRSGFVWSTDPANTAEELEEAESYFVLGCRRLGGLKHSLLGSQCFFVAGASDLRHLAPPILPHQVSTQEKTTKRLEECMYWSCFKSEIEFRVELPLPQSELASYHHPQMFPSPRSPAHFDGQDAPPGRSVRVLCEDSTPSLLREPSVSSTHSRDYVNPRERVARLCNEEESWYYYLTEIALRRIGNRIINTFFRKDPSAWLDVKPLLRIALEFDTQVSAWSANLPTAMKQWETNYAIRRPEPAVLFDQGGNHVLQELSCALENRLLEVRSWLYQPFMYWLIHSPVFAA
ncbi:hypothetical protein LTR33_004810 [Friedmanniomyces endolithicus]|nr:hypothetical protein LTR33_004810 [Friedmanniomyces endolithicus]